MDVVIREELFGATIFYSKLGKKFFVSRDEFENIILNNVFPEDCTNGHKPKIKRIIRLNGNEKSNKFSFADIAYIELTRDCNLRCKHCLNNSGLRDNSEIIYSELLRIIQSLIKSGIFEIRFTGGEPLLYSKIYDIISYCAKNHIYVSIGTNGTLITEDVIKKLKSSGLNKVIISLDGTKKAHDSIRGVGNFDKTINAIKLLKQYKIDYKINSVIMKNNMNDIIVLAKQMYKEKNPLFIRRFIESGRGIKLKNNTLSFKDYVYVKEQLKAELENKKIIRGHYINLSDETLNSRITIPFKIPISCKAGQRSLVITPDGNIHFCGFLAAQGFPPIGNISNVKDFRVFWENINYEKMLKKLNDRLEEYNSQNNIQKTNCLAYVQNMLNKRKKLYIFYSKDNLFNNQLKKIQKASFIETEIIEIENFCLSSKIMILSDKDCVYFLCCNSKDVKICINKITGGNIINKKFLINRHDKLYCQKKLMNESINVPKIYKADNTDINLFNYPIFCKENKHQGITFQAYNVRTINYFFQNYDINDFYFEESIKTIEEIKLYYINGKIILKNGYYNNNEQITGICKNVSKVLNLEVFSIDLLKFNDKYYVIDTNASPGFYLSEVARKEFLYYIGELCK